MREIKFRAWNKVDAKMYHSNFEVTADGRIRTYGIYEKVILMQYTGLKDKNAKEIYEGDIVIGLTLPCSDSYVCQWDNEGATFVFYDKETDIYLGEAAFKELTVIGNIYENPELINQSAINKKEG